MTRLKPTSKEIALHLAQLTDTPLKLRQMVTGLNNDDLHWSLGPKAWSIVEILAHVRACADVWTFSMYAMLTENQPNLPLLDERRWAKTLGYAALTFETSFNTFAAQREDLVRTLRGLSPEQWERSGQIEGRNHSVFSQARRMALHEVEHLTQFQVDVDKLKVEKQS